MLINGGKTQRLTLCGLFTALICIGAFIKIPVPYVPFTLQYLFTMLAGIVLGGKLGAACVLAYIAMGLAGLPVFAEGGGIGYVLQPSFGYLLGFVVGTYVTGTISHAKKSPSGLRFLAANFAGLAVVYSFGIVYYYLISRYYTNTDIGFKALLLYCFVLPVPGDIFLCFLAARAGKVLCKIHLSDVD